MTTEKLPALAIEFGFSDGFPTPMEAVTFSLMCAVTAPTEDFAKDFTKEAENIASGAGMTQGEVATCQKMATMRLEYYKIGHPSATHGYKRPTVKE